MKDKFFRYLCHFISDIYHIGSLGEQNFSSPFVTFRLAGSLPKLAVEKLKATREMINQEIAEYLTE